MKIWRGLGKRIVIASVLCGLLGMLVACSVIQATWPPHTLANFRSPYWLLLGAVLVIALAAAIGVAVVLPMVRRIDRLRGAAGGVPRIAAFRSMWRAPTPPCSRAVIRRLPSKCSRTWSRMLSYTATLVVTSRSFSRRTRNISAWSCPGVQPPEPPRLAERTFRSDEARQRDPRGGGLGLAISAEVCAACQWSLRFEPENPRGLRVVIEGLVCA